MRRKIISLAKSTNVVTLPNKWCESNSLKKGDEVLVYENGGSIVVSPIQTEKLATLDISGCDPMIRRILGAAFKAGYDEMRIHYSTEEEKEIAEEVISQEFIGFEVIFTDSEKLLIEARSISEPSPENFENMLRRMMMIISSMGGDIIVNPGDEEILRQVAERDKEVNKIADYCRRTINKNSLLRISDRYLLNPPLYFIVEQLEKIGDEFRDLSSICGCIDTDVASMAKGYFDSFRKLFHDFDIKTLASFGKRRYELRDIFGEYPAGECAKCIKICNSIVEKTFDMNGPLIAMSIKDESSLKQQKTL